LCGSREDAEDLVQETFTRVLARPRLLSGDDEVYYLMRVLRNTMGQPEQALEMQEVYAAIAALPQDRRLALVAVDVLGLSYRHMDAPAPGQQPTQKTVRGNETLPTGVRVPRMRSLVLSDLVPYRLGGPERYLSF
jgi:RNA polymerase sigma-70 factor (ECF subfamily)